MVQTIFRIINNRALTDSVYEMKLAGDTSAVTAPGQFVNIRIDGLYLRRPISVCDVSDNELTLVYKVVGHGTEIMSRMDAGTELDILTGLGNGYDLSKSGQTPLLIGGGVGIPPLYLLAKRLKDQGKDIRVILGFNTSDEIFYKKEFEDLLKEASSDCSLRSQDHDGGAFSAHAASEDNKPDTAGNDKRVLLATADGSSGCKGFVTDALKLLHDEADNGGTPYSYVYTCGPEPMLKAVYNSIRTGAQFSFEERMGCGFGACMGCSCRTVTGYKRICKDGPVLEKSEILW